MKAKKHVLDNMIRHGFAKTKPYFWYLENYSLNELYNMEKILLKKS